MNLLNRGDTFSVDCKDVNLDYKLDLCVIADPVEAVTGVFASAKDSACGKYYRDKLKSILVSKCHLNSLLEKLHFLPESQVTNFAYLSYKSRDKISHYTSSLRLINKFILC